MSTGEVYNLYGLNVRCPLRLGADLASATELIDYVLDFRGADGGNLHVELDGGECVVTRQGTIHKLQFPELCTFVIDPERKRVIVVPTPTADQELIGQLIQGSLIAYLLYLQGIHTVHASAVEFGGVGIAFAADTGGGKSTLAALMCSQAGAALITDDVLRLESDGQV